MSLDMQQMIFQQDPIAMMPKVNVEQFKCMDDLINGILNDLGEKGFKVGMGTISKSLDTAAAVHDRVSSGVKNVMETNIAPTGSPRGESSATPSNGLSMKPTIEYDHLRAQSGQYSTPHTPVQGLSLQERGR